MNTQQDLQLLCTGGSSGARIFRPCGWAAWTLTALLATGATAVMADDSTPPVAATSDTTAPDAVSPDAATGDGAVEVTIEGIASTEGLIYASLFVAADGFPNERERAIANQSVPASESQNGTLVLNFAAVPAGKFAISIMHDINSNKKLDTNFMGIPTEDYGFSQNPNSMFGPPSFDKAAVSLAAGETQQLVIKLK